MKYNLESFQAVGRMIDLQNHRVTVLGHCSFSSFAWIPGRWWIFSCHRLWSNPQKAKSLICQQCSSSFLSSRQTFLRSHALGCLSPFVFNLFFLTVLERSLSRRSAMLGTCQVDPICMFHSHYRSLSPLGAEPLAKRQIAFLFVSQASGMDPKRFSRAPRKNVVVSLPVSRPSCPPCA